MVGEIRTYLSQQCSHEPLVLFSLGETLRQRKVMYIDEHNMFHESSEILLIQISCL